MFSLTRADKATLLGMILVAAFLFLTREGHLALGIICFLVAIPAFLVAVLTFE